jgi:hypothetical protein
MAKLLPSSNFSIVKSQKSGIVKKSKLLNIKSKNIILNKKPTFFYDSLLSIDKKVITIDKLLKEFLFLYKKEEEIGKKGREQERFSSKEKELEKKKPPLVKGIKLPTPPKMGFFDWIKNFITQTILGFFAVRLIDFLPQLLKILPVIIKVSDFIINIGGKLLDGLVTFIDWGYKAYDATRGFVKNIFGEDGAKQFDQLSGLLNKFLNLAIIAGMVAAGSGGGGGRGGAAAGRPRPGTGGRPRVTTSGGGGAGRPDIRNPLRQRPTVTTGGKPQFRLPGTGPKITGSGAKGILSSVRPFLKRIPLPVVGALIDFGLSVALGENPGRAAFRAIGAGLLGAVGAAAGSVVPVAGNFIGGLLGGAAGDLIGGALYDAFFGSGVKSNKGKTVKAAGGGRSTTKPKRTIGKKRKQRTLSFTPRKIKPGVNTGGEDKIQSLFPNPDKPRGVFGFLGGLFGGNKSEENLEKPKKEKTANPQDFLVKSNDKLGKSDFFGPFFTIAIKTVLGQKPDVLDYRNAGTGLNAWIQSTFKTGSLAFSGGGEVDIKQFFSGEDFTNVISKSVEDSVSKEVDMTIRDLAKEISLRPVGREEMIQDNIRRGEQPGIEDGFEVGPAGSSGDKLTMARNLMRDLGLTAAQAAGIVGNMAAESGVENARPQGSRPGTKAPLKVDGVTGYGLVQWTSRGRQQALADFAKSRGADLSKPLSMDIEYQFFLKEFRGAYGHVLDQIKKASDVKTASTIFMQQYEIPAGYKTEAKIMERYNMSKPIYDKLSRGEGKATEGKGTYIMPSSSGAGGIVGGSGKFIQGNSGNSRGVHFHIGPGSQTKGTILQSKYNADARASAAKVVDYFLKKGSTVYDGRRGTYYKSSKEVAEAQKAHSAEGSQGGIDLQVDFEKPHPFPLRTLGMAFRPNGFGVSADIAGSNSFVAHGRYDEKGRKAPQTGGLIAYEKGGETLDGPHIAMVGEKGREFVIDADSKESIDRTFPGFLVALNDAKYDEAINVLRNFASYEAPYAEPEIAFIPLPSQDSGGNYGTTPKPSLSYGGSSIDSVGEQISDSLMYG